MPFWRTRTAAACTVSTLCSARRSTEVKGGPTAAVRGPSEVVLALLIVDADKMKMHFGAPSSISDLLPSADDCSGWDVVVANQ